MQIILQNEIAHIYAWVFYILTVVISNLSRFYLIIIIETYIFFLFKQLATNGLCPLHTQQM